MTKKTNKININRVKTKGRVRIKEGEALLRLGKVDAGRLRIKEGELQEKLEQEK